MKISGKEKRQVLTATIDRIEREMRDCNNSAIYIEVHGKKVKFETKITFDQVDKKVIKELCGCNGSFWLVSSAPFVVYFPVYFQSQSSKFVKKFKKIVKHDFKLLTLKYNWPMKVISKRCI